MLVHLAAALAFGLLAAPAAHAAALPVKQVPPVPTTGLRVPEPAPAAGGLQAPTAADAPQVPVPSGATSTPGPKPAESRIFQSAPLVLRPEQTPYTIVLRSHRGVNDTFGVSFHALDGGEKFIRVDSPVSIPAGGTATVRLRLGDATGAEWPRRGYLALLRRDTLVETLGVTLYPRTVPLASPLPVTKWTVEVRRWMLFPEMRKCAPVRGFNQVLGTCVRANVVPVAMERIAGDGPDRGTVLGFLSNDSLWRGTAVVVAGGRDSVARTTAGERIELAGLGDVGQYTGLVHMGDAGKVELKVLVTHGLLLAVATILLGVGLASRLQRYTTKDRLVLLTRARILDLAASVSHARIGFQAALEGRPIGARYSIEATIQAGRDELLASLAELDRRHPVLTFETAEFKALEEELKAYGAQMSAWPLVAGALRRLDLALDAAERWQDAWRPPPETAATRPRILRERDALLGGRELEAEAIEEEWKRLERRAAFAANWHRLNQEAADAVAEAGKQADPRGRVVHHDAQVVWTRLWSSEGDDEADIEAKLQAIQAKIQAPQEADRPMAAKAADVQDGTGGPELVREERVTAPPPPAESPYRRLVGRLLGRGTAKPVPDAASVERRVRTLDRSLSLLATLVAILVALNEVYYDGPFFGTPRDYLSAFVWAFGVRAGFEVLRQFSERSLVRLPFMRAG